MAGTFNKYFGSSSGHHLLLRMSMHGLVLELYAALHAQYPTHSFPEEKDEEEHKAKHNLQNILWVLQSITASTNLA